MVRWDLCNYSDTCVVVKGTKTVRDTLILM